MGKSSEIKFAKSSGGDAPQFQSSNDVTRL